jgi:heptosyltransferase I
VRVLLIKMSSLGDVVHTLPAVTEAAAHGIRFDWVVEEAYAPVVADHPAVAAVLPIAWRRWRRDLSGSGAELTAFVRSLRARRYELVLDAQGLWKSALVRALARGVETWGFDHTCAREGASAVFYKHHLNVDRNMHAIDRLRRLFAAAFGYQLAAHQTDTPAASGLERPEAAVSRICLLCHGTTWPSKHWPQAMWRSLAQDLQQQGYQVRLPAGTEAERARAQDIVDFPGSEARVLPAMPLKQLMSEIAGAGLVIGVDSGLSHLAASLGVPTLTLYGSTDAQRTGCRGLRAMNLQADFPCSPCRSRHCSYSGEARLWQQQEVTPACYSSIDPDTVMRAAGRL